MNNYVISFVFLISLISISHSRVSDKYNSNFKFGINNKKEFSSNHSVSEKENDLKWKRRHKRRKKAKNRTPKRGK
tara:strand:- start:277 stop:501 length:225 start_codon:yes stop_codon:yes gene_type:complete